MSVDYEQEWLYRTCETGSPQLVISCKDGKVDFVKNSVFFLAKFFGISFEEFCESDSITLDGVVVDQLKTSLGVLFISNLLTVEDLFYAVDTQKS